MNITYLLRIIRRILEVMAGFQSHICVSTGTFCDVGRFTIARSMQRVTHYALHAVRLFVCPGPAVEKKTKINPATDT